MVRPKKPRKIRFNPGAVYFKPRAIALKDLEEVVLEVSELEAIRLCDLKNINQVEAAKKMNISQSTLSRILISGRKKIAEALIKGKSIKIQK